MVVRKLALAAVATTVAFIGITAPAGADTPVSDQSAADLTGWVDDVGGPTWRTQTFSMALDDASTTSSGHPGVTVVTNDDTRYFRIDPSTGTFAPSTFADAVVLDDKLRVVGSYLPDLPRLGARVAATHVYNVDPARAGSRQIEVDFATTPLGGPARGQGVGEATFRFTYRCYPDDPIEGYGSWVLDDGAGSTLTGDFDATSDYPAIVVHTGVAIVDVTGGTGQFAGATGRGWLTWVGPGCVTGSVSSTGIGHLSAGVLPG